MTGLLGIARFSFHEGRVEEFKTLSRRCMDIVREQDTGTLRYEVYVNADESEAIVIEEYTDVAALIEHSQHLGDDLSARITATASVRGELLGEMSAEFRAQLADGPVQPFSLALSKD